MAKCTREQVNRWESKLSNGFEFDLMYFLTWGEKRAERSIELEDGRIIKAEISWYEIRDGYRYTGLVRPKMNISLWRKSSTPGMLCSSGLGYTIELTDKDYSKRNWNEIAKLTTEWDDERILKIAYEHMAELKNAFVC